MKRISLILTLAALMPMAGANAQMQAAEPAPMVAYSSPGLSANYPDGHSPEPFVPPRGHRGRNNPIGKNVLSGSPMNLVVVNGYGCYAFGFSYERLLGPDEMLGIQVPVHFAFGTDHLLDGDDGHFFYTAPGLQVHVAGARRIFDYAIGPSVILGNMNERIYYSNRRDVVRNTFTSGVMIDNNFNFQRRHFLFGIHLAFGTTFPNAAYDNRFFMQFGIRMGGRF